MKSKKKINDILKQQADEHNHPLPSPVKKKIKGGFGPLIDPWG